VPELKGVTFGRLFKFLFPSWNFFDSLELVPSLYFRHQTGAATWTEWKSVARKISRSPCALFYSPDSLFQLAAYSLLEEFCLTGDEKTLLPSLRAWVKMRVREENPESQAYQFEIRAGAPGENRESARLVWTSGAERLET
jgi:hypothetical protein